MMIKYCNIGKKSITVKDLRLAEYFFPIINKTVKLTKGKIQ